MRETLQSEGRVPDPSRYAVIGSIVGVAVIAGGSELASYAYHKDHAPGEILQQSAIVAGVRSQVESHMPTEGCDFSLKQPYKARNCEGSPDKPMLLIEQCPRDVWEARQGRSTQSVVLRLGEVGSKCVTEWVYVSPKVWAQKDDGDIIVFEGSPNQHLHH